WGISISGVATGLTVASGPINFKVGATTVGSFTATGNLGIGVASPGAVLDMAGGPLVRLTNDNAVIRLCSATTPANFGQLAIDSSGSTYLDSYTGGLRLGTQTAQNITFRTTNTERMRISAT